MMGKPLFLKIHLSVVQKLLQWDPSYPSLQQRSSVTAIVVFSKALDEIAMTLPEKSKGKKSNQEVKLTLTGHLATVKITQLIP